MIVSLIIYHAFAPFYGSWPSPMGVVGGDVGIVYKWIAIYAYFGMLETFVLMSGFLSAKVLFSKDFNRSIFLRKKLTRLYVPCLFWGFLWMEIDVIPPPIRVSTLLSLLQGAGHLWYLPMLLWCMVFACFLLRRVSVLASIIITSILAFIQIDIGFRIPEALYYLLFYNWGLILYRYIHVLYKYIEWICPICIVAFPLLVYMYVNNIDYMHTHFYIGRLFKLLLSFTGCMMYMGVGFYGMHRLTTARSIRFVTSIANASFTIYLLQEILLRLLYYKTSYCARLGVFYPIVAIVLILFLHRG